MIELPWPPKELRPNARPHFMAKAKATKKAREWARLATLASGASCPAEGRFKIILGFYPPTAHDRDTDNLVASCKAYLDGVADALRVNDSRFDPVPVQGEPVKHGKVVVTIDSFVARPIGELIQPILDRCVDMSLLHLAIRRLPDACSRKGFITSLYDAGSITTEETALLIEAYQLETA